MLGEDHSLTQDFPEHLNTIKKLNSNDQEFADKAKKYNALDKEIRTLELQDAPIDDEEMLQLKHDRVVLKDWLHQQLLKAS
ncbi:YdcH family protein [Pseudoalteromonas sp. MIP2626]|uniref:YdcH family protein n=1 Tax=Pseudoalteromonas sp. MIP2626 TaxID=2705464 RepID=UPI0015C72E69|nr:YdcH family protein [Pseudoalteromonas sp. MIP2626]NYR12465.1 YdcH family protein [Pseudoalteromonas sp. MIP2626]